MKAITYQGLKDVKVKEVQDPKIEKPDDAIIKITSTAICGSDLHLIHGLIPNMSKDNILDHEAMGIVEEVGPEATDLKKGDRVIVPFPVACGHCWYCDHDLYSSCDNSNPHGEAGGILGYSETFGGYAGGQAEYLRVPYANVGPLKVPEELDDEQVLFLTEHIFIIGAIENGYLAPGRHILDGSPEVIMRLLFSGWLFEAVYENVLWIKTGEYILNGSVFAGGI